MICFQCNRRFYLKFNALRLGALFFTVMKFEQTTHSAIHFTIVLMFTEYSIPCFKAWIFMIPLIECKQVPIHVQELKKGFCNSIFEFTFMPSIIPCDMPNNWNTLLEGIKATWTQNKSIAANIFRFDTDTEMKMLSSIVFYFLFHSLNFCSSGIFLSYFPYFALENKFVKFCSWSGEWSLVMLIHSFATESRKSHGK